MKPKTRKARCKNVMVILMNTVHTLPLIREVTYPAAGDFDNGPTTYAVVKYKTIVSSEVFVPIDCVVFLKD